MGSRDRADAFVLFFLIIAIVGIDYRMQQFGPTRNTVTHTFTQNPITVTLSELLPRVEAFRVSFLLLNLDGASTAIPIGAGMPTTILLYSNYFASISNGNYSFVNSQRRNVIASYPISLSFLSSSGGRSTWKFAIRQEWTKITSPENINRFDFSVGLLSPNASSLLNLGPLDSISVGLEVETKSS